MALREFTDRHGREWRVWETYPRAVQVGHLPLRNPGGWLTFESGAEKRRLAPIPEGWDGHDTPGLLLLLTKAELVAPRPVLPDQP